jgi:hypothetical protein
MCQTDKEHPVIGKCRTFGDEQSGDWILHLMTTVRDYLEGTEFVAGLRTDVGY